MALRWTGKSNSSCFPGREQVRTWQAWLPDRKQKPLWSRVSHSPSPPVAHPDHAARPCEVIGSRLQGKKPHPQAFCCRPWPSRHPGIRLPKLSCFKDAWGPPSQPHSSVGVCSRNTACPFGLACTFHMCRPGPFPPSGKSFSLRHKSNGGSKHTRQTPHGLSS